MGLSEIINIIEQSYNEDRNKNFIVIIDGKKHKKKLFVSGNNLVYEYAKHSRNKGYECLYTDKWSEIYPQPKTDNTTLMRKRLNKVYVYLCKSGLWGKYKKDIEFLLSLSNTDLQELVKSNYETYCKFKEQNGLHISGDMFFNLLTKGIKTIKYEKYTRLEDSADFAKAIKERREFSRKWYNGYDISIDCKPVQDDMYAWYSEEYKGLLNGHYYIALDEKHVWFCEDD